MTYNQTVMSNAAVGKKSDEIRAKRLANLTGRGRPKGTPNKTTKLVKEAIAGAFEKLGGEKGLVEWAKADGDNLKVFYTALLPKLIPVQAELTGKDGEAIQFEQRVREDASVVTSAIVGLAARIRASGMVEPTHH